jgi:hypothetical protein
VECEKGFQVPSKWICPPFFKFFPTTTVQGKELCYNSSMAQSSRAAGRGKKKGRDFPTNVVPSPSFSTGSANVPSAGSGAATTISSVEKTLF